MTASLVEIREPGQSPVRITVEHSVEVGRECDGVVLADPKVSRRHVALEAAPGSLTVRDLGSSNGTYVDGAQITGPVAVGRGSVVQVGDSELRVVAVAGAPAAPPTPRAASSASATRGPGAPLVADESEGHPNGPVGSAPTAPQVPHRPVVDELAALEGEAAVVRYRPGTAGEDAARAYLDAVRRARRALAGFGAEPWGVRPEICLVDPFPDPGGSGEVVTEGAVVDPDRNEIWIVTTPETPPEPPERSLALLFGASLPAGDELTPLLEGYGLHVAESPDPDPTLREMELPPLGSATGELGATMALSFVRYLIDREGDDSFRRFLASAQPGRLDLAAQEMFGSDLAKLQVGWRQQLARGAPKVKLREFVKLSMRYLRPHRRRQVEMMLYLVLGLGFTLVFPFVFRHLLDVAIPAGRLDLVFQLLGILAAAFAISLVAQLRRAYLSAYISGSVIREIRTGMFERLQSLSAAWFHRHEEGDVLSRFFSDVGEVEAGLSQVVREGLLQLLTILVASVVLLVLSPLLGAIVLAGAPLVAVIYRRMSEGALKRSMAVQERTGALLNVTSENYSAQPVVKAFGLELREGGRFRRSSDRLFDSQVRLQLFGGLFSLSVNSIVTLLRLVVLGLGAWLILQGQLTIGGLVAFMSVMGEVLNPVSTLTRVGQQLQTSTGALLRVNEVLEAPIEVPEAPDAVDMPPLSHELRLQDVTFGYTPDEPVLHDVSCAIPAGSRVAFVGPSGAGKSSVLWLLTRFYDPDQGAVTFDGRDLRQATLASLRGQMGVVFQDVFLFDTTVRENIRMGRLDASDAEVEAAARDAEVHDFVSHLPQGYDTLVGERGGRLSGGQRQRIAIARALLRNPSLLILDEATSALDPRTERLISATLERVGEGRTTVAVTHRLTSCVDYDRIFVLEAGRLVEQGSHDELLALGGVYAELWAEQTGGQVAARPEFDVAAALARVPLFADLDEGTRAEVASRLRSSELAAGERLSEDGNRLVIVRSGRGRVRSPGVDGRLRTVTEIEAGGYFGLSALLGSGHDAVLEAVDRMELLVCDRDVLTAMAREVPAVDAALAGGRATQALPAGGHRLSRTTLGPRTTHGPSAVLPDVEDIRRTSGVIPGVRT